MVNSTNSFLFDCTRGQTFVTLYLGTEIWFLRVTEGSHRILMVVDLPRLQACVVSLDLHNRCHIKDIMLNVTLITLCSISLSFKSIDYLKENTNKHLATK